MSSFHTILAVIVGLLLAGGPGHAAEAKPEAALEAAAERFAQQLEGFNGEQASALTVLAGELSKIAECGEATSKVIEDGVRTISDRRRNRLHAVLRDYYLAHHEESPGFAVWESYVEIQLSDPFRESQREMTAQWEALVKTTLSAGEQERWSKEMQQRRNRLEKAVQTFLRANFERLEGTVRDGFDARLASLVTRAELPPAKAASLQAAVDAAVAACLAAQRAFNKRVEGGWNDDVTACTAKSLEAMEQAGRQSYFFGSGTVEKAGRKAFDEVLQRIVNSEELARIKKLDDELKARIDKIAQSMADNLQTTSTQKNSPVSDGRIKLLAEAAGLDKKREREFEDRLKAAEKMIVEQWKKSFIAIASRRIKQSADSASDVEKTLQGMEQGRFLMSDTETDERAAVEREKSWNDAMAALIKPDEKARWEAAERMGQERRSTMMAHMAVAEFDSAVRLQPDQRQALERLAMEAAKPMGTYQGDVADLWQRNLNGALILIPGLDAKAVEALLDESQKKVYQTVVTRWQARWQAVQRQLHTKS